MKAEKARTRYYIDRTGFFAEAAVLLLILAVVFRLLGCIGMFENGLIAVMHIAVPCCACVLMAVCIFLCGRNLFFLSAIPTLLGTVFFVFGSMDAENKLASLLRVLLYVLVAVVYFVTLFGAIRTKWIISPMFFALLVWRLMQDIPRLTDTVHVMSFAEGMREMSVLCMLTAMAFVGLGIRKRKPESLPTVVGEEILPTEDSKDAASENTEGQTQTETEHPDEPELNAENTDES